MSDNPSSGVMQITRQLFSAAFIMATAAACAPPDDRGAQADTIASAQPRAGAQAPPAEARPAQAQPWAMRAIAEIEFTPNPYGASAVLWGDPRTGPYGSLNRFPAGTVIPLHTHTNDGHVVVIRGTMYNYRPGDAERPLGPGSYMSEPGGIPHITRCGRDAECLVFVTQERALDFNVLDSTAVRQ